MAEIIQVAYEIPEEFLGLLTGDLSRFGSVIRDSTGIIGHLKEVELPEFDKLNSKKIMFGLAGLAASAVVVGSIAFIIKSKRQKKKNTDPLNIYLNSVIHGDLNLKTINDLIDTLDELSLNYHHVSEENFKDIIQLEDLITQHTENLAKNNSIALTDILNNSTSNSSAFDRIINQLRIQKNIFEIVA